MSITIGSKLESDFSDPIGMLSDCHRRIERFLAGLIAIGEEARGGPIPEATRGQFETALRYFRDAAPKHTEDEEESLFPRLLESATQTDPVLPLLDHLKAEHIGAVERHRRVDRLGTKWLAEDCLSPGDEDLLMVNLRELRSEYEEHIAVEDKELFPLAARMLSTEELKRIGEEMAARRGLRISV
jgi:hemerythrin-like domain-containing protein